MKVIGADSHDRALAQIPAISALTEVEPSVARKAICTVIANAKDSDEAVLFLAMLGLIELDEILGD